MKKSLSKGISKESKTKLLLMAALFCSCLIIFRDYLFGNQVMVYNDVGGDTWQQYTMYYASIVNHLRAGKFSLWDFTNGIGINLFFHMPDRSFFDSALSDRRSTWTCAYAVLSGSSADFKDSGSRTCVLSVSFGIFL